MEREGNRTAGRAFKIIGANTVCGRSGIPRAALPANGEGLVAGLKDSVSIARLAKGNLDGVRRQS
jgi:hypothetical protein